MPARVSQQCRDPAIAVATVLTGQPDHIRDQAFFISAPHGDFALCGSVLLQNAAGAAFRDIQLSTNTVNAGATTSGA